MNVIVSGVVVGGRMVAKFLFHQFYVLADRMTLYQ
jgi:hypothetical protein